MKIFQNLQELLDFIPNCIICGKQLEIQIIGTVPNSGINANKFKINGWHTIDVCLRMKLIDGQLQSKNKNYPLIIDLATNNILIGVEIIDKMMYRHHNSVIVNKKCYTCQFKIRTMYTAGIAPLKTKNQFPVLDFKELEIIYTMNNNRLVSIYSNNFNESMFVRVNGRTIESFKLDFSKIKNLKQLNNKIKTVMVFQ